MKQLEFMSIQMGNGEIFDGKKNRRTCWFDNQQVLRREINLRRSENSSGANKVCAGRVRLCQS